jgi:hypothetical protein
MRPINAAASITGILLLLLPLLSASITGVLPDQAVTLELTHSSRPMHAKVLPLLLHTLTRVVLLAHSCRLVVW